MLIKKVINGVETEVEVDVETTDDTKVEPKVETKDETKKLEDMIQGLISRSFENYIKTSQTKVEPKVEPKKDSTNDYDAKISDLEKRLEAKYERQNYMSSLNANQKTFIQEIEGWENFTTNQIKKIISKVSLPSVEITNEDAKVEDLDSIIKGLRGKK